MMPLGYSEINENNKISQNKKKNRRKTIKKRNSNNRVEKFLNSMNSKESFQSKENKKISHKTSTRKSIKSYDSDEDEFGEPYESNTIKESDNENEINNEEEDKRQASIMNWDKDKLESFGLLREGLNQQELYQKEQTKFMNQFVPSNITNPQNIPYYSQLANSQELSGSRDELMRKLNKIVYVRRTTR